MLEQRYSDNDVSKRDIPSFIEPRPPLIQNPFMRPRPQKGTNLLELFEEDSEIDEPELVQVYLRLKPCNVPNTLYEVRSDKCLVTSLDTATAGHGRRTQHNVSKMYTFSKIFGSGSNQKEIFEEVVKDNLKKLPEGQNFTLLTYGASGSGKTYTLMGTVGAPGLVPRSLEYVFRLVDAAQQPTFRPAENGAEKLSYSVQDYELQWVKRLRHVSAPLRDKYRRMSTQLHSDLTASSIDFSNRIKHYVWVSFVEIYNEAIYDLLAPPEKRTKLRIREDSTGNVYVKGATQAFVRSGEEAYDVMVAGKHNLVVAATGVHAQSSRSHCIFTITMLTETAEGSVRTSYVRLCDLAGCERARATRNTGARMAESRAINSSLHVLERCLHMLRRKQRTGNDALVPYRESKLTRLLGSGLSGARGEAVSMVVTLNPSPQYAHETKHVLTLAAVAQDIQINNTILGYTTLESSTQDTTISSNSEVMKLRSDNERLHFELVQAQARNKELLASMEERQQESANTMRELVEEAKDLTKQYYEAQLEALRCEMEDMAEEYESRLAKVPAPPAAAATPTRYLQSKVTELMTEIAVLEEKLNAECLARSRAEKEVQYLRTCIEERDEKAFKDATPPREDIMALSDSEHESDEDTNDPFNESLEPIFRKELNKSILALQNEKQNDTASIHTIDNIDEECDSDIEKSHDTLKNDDSKNSTYVTGEDEESDLSKKNDATHEKVDNSRLDDSVKSSANETYNNNVSQSKNDDGLKTDTKEISSDDINDISDNDIQFKNESPKNTMRGTYFVSDSKVTKRDISIESTQEKESFRGTYFVKDSVTDTSKSDEFEESNDDVFFKEPIVKEKAKVDILSVSEEKLVINQMFGDKSDDEIKVPEVVLSSSNSVRKVKSNVLMKSPEKLERSANKLIREKSNIDRKVPENIFKAKVNEEMSEKSSNIKVPDCQLVRVKSNFNMEVPEIIFKTQDNQLVMEKSNLLMKIPENPVMKISKEKSNIDIKVPEKITKSEDRQLVKEKSNLTEYTTENLGKMSKEKSNIDIKVPEKIKSEDRQLMREKSNLQKNLTEQTTENPVKLTKEKSNIHKEIKNTQGIIKEKSSLDIKVPSKALGTQSIITREKSNTDLKILEKVSQIQLTTPEKVTENAITNIMREKSNYDMQPPKKISESLVNKIIRSFKNNHGSDNSLRQFEQLEKASKECTDGVQKSDYENIQVLNKKKTYFDNLSVSEKVHEEQNETLHGAKEKRTYFDNIDVNVKANKRVNDLITNDDERSPSIVKENVCDNFEPSTIKKLLGESFTKPVITTSVHKARITKKQNSVDIFDGFDSPIALKPKAKVDNVEVARQSIEKLVLGQQSAEKTDSEPKLFVKEDIVTVMHKVQVKKEIKLEPMSSVEEANETKADVKKITKLEAVSIDAPNETMNKVQENDSENNTIEDFENIYKDITAPRATEFDLLVTQEVTDSTENKDKEKVKYNLRKKNKTDDYKVDNANDEEILAESHAKCENKVRKRPLRLRRRKNQDDESDDKLKDIVNLQSEFSDITLDVPTTRKVVKDIPSPEKGLQENLPPLFGIQSCPSKSVTRSRRKLFTPRAEPLEESLSQTGDSNERVYVPRPSYHRPRARRKL